MIKSKGSRIEDRGSRIERSETPSSILHPPFSTIFFLTLIFFLAFAEAAEAAIAFRIAGTVIGSFFGPLGGMIGGMIGGLIGGLIFPEEGTKTKGPRIDDKSVQSAAYGAPIFRTWGTDRVAAQVIFSSGLIEKKHKTEMGGKGMTPTATSITYTYSIDTMLSFGRRAKGIQRLWADKKLIYDATGTANIKKSWAKEGRKFVVRDGNESQLPSALEESYHGAGLCSAHRGLFCIEFENFQLANFANHPPLFEAEIYTEGTEDFGIIASYVPPAAPYSWWVGSWGYVDDNGEVWAMYYPHSTPYLYTGYARIFHWTLDQPSAPVDEFHSLWTDSGIVQTASISNYVRVRSDEPSSSAFGSNGQGVGLSYFRLEDGTRLDILQSEIGGWSRPEILVKYGEAIYVLFNLGTPAGYLIKFDAVTGLKLAESAVINSTTGSSSVTDMGRSESYLWALVGKRQLKLDPDTLALIADTDLSASLPDQSLAMAVISDSELRFVTASSSGTRFFIRTGDAAPVLDKHDVENTYASIRAFGKWGLRYVNDMYVVDFGGYIGGFEARIDFFGPSAATLDIALWKIVRDLNIMAGLDSVVTSVPPTAGDIAVSELTDMVHGYTISRAMTARDALVQLQQSYFFDCREKDLKLDYPKRGKAAVKSLPGADLAVRSSITETLPDRLTQTRARETELPLRVHVIYNNWEFAYLSGHEYAPRLITDSRKMVDVQIAVALTSTEARQIADTLLAMAWLEGQTFQLKTSRKHIRIDAADNVEVVITEE